MDKTANEGYDTSSEEKAGTAAPPVVDGQSDAPASNMGRLTGTHLLVALAVMQGIYFLVGRFLYRPLWLGASGDLSSFWTWQGIAPLTTLAMLLWFVRRKHCGFEDAGMKIPPARAWLKAMGIFAITWCIMMSVTLSLGAIGFHDYFALDTNNIFSMTLRLGPSSFPFILMCAALILIGPSMEELVFRGIGMGGMLRTFPVTTTLIATSLTFGAIHGFYNFFPTVIQGFGYGVIRIRTGSVYCAMLAHGINNALSIALSLYLVS